MLGRILTFKQLRPWESEQQGVANLIGKLSAIFLCTFLSDNVAKKKRKVVSNSFSSMYLMGILIPKSKAKCGVKQTRPISR